MAAITESAYAMFTHDIARVLHAVTDERRTFVIMQPSGQQFVIKPLHLGKPRRKSKMKEDLAAFRSSDGGMTLMSKIFYMLRACIETR